MNYPGALDDAVSRWLAEQRGSLRDATQALQASYRRGEASAADDLAAYVSTRLPATFAVNARVMGEIAARLPTFNPASMFDCGAGPGTASWAALQQWSSIESVTQLEKLPAFCALAAQFNTDSALLPLLAAKIVQANLSNAPDISADLVIASYVLAEVPKELVASICQLLWARTAGVLVLIEPGTPEGFARIRSARKTLLGQAKIAAPCTHANTCPMTKANWCHFKTRLPRSREHMHAKSAHVPFEDEAYSYVVLSREAPAAADSRIVAPVDISKVAAKVHLCGAPGLITETIASRNKPAYKRARKARWGDLWSNDT